MAPAFTQAKRALSVKTPLGADALLLLGFRGGDAISQLFRYHLDLIAPNETEVAFDALLGKKCTVTFRWGKENSKERYFNGICVRIAQGERDDVFTGYSMELVPSAWLLTRKAQSRIFQRMTVPDILKKVLTGFSVSFELQGTFQPRDFCVQYRETDFNFACRLMEEEGIFYFFKHSKDDHTMVLGNSSGAHPDVPEQAKVPYEEKFGGSREELRIESWEKTQELRSGKYTLWDHSFELPHKHLEADKLIQDSVAIGSVTHKLKVADNDQLEIYDFPGEYAQRFDGVNAGGGDQAAELQKIFQDNKRTVEIRMQQEAVESLEIEGQGECRHFVSGHKFTLERHFNADGAYVLTSTEHVMTPASANYRSAFEGQPTYRNTFTCIPVALPFRPSRVTPKPVVQGTQSAVVVGPAGEEIFTDKYARVKVQFHWDREGKYDVNSSCWIRVASAWAGKQWGMINIPRIGQEVLVDFLEGDPDQPIIVGNLYNADMMPPYTLPANKTQSGIQSRSSLQGGPPNFNEFKFEDKKGSELLTIHAERNQSISVEVDESHTVGVDRSKSIGRDETEDIGRDQKVHIGRDRTESVDHDESITIGNDRHENVAGFELIHIAKNRGLHIKGDDILDIGGHREMQVGKYFVISVNDSFGLSAGEDIEITVGDSSLKMNKNGTIELAGKDIKIVGSNEVKASAPTVEVTGQQEVKMGVGSQNVTCNTMKVETSGAAISSSAVGTHEISGALVKIN
jgi:type VI secretion system secreted protein VgrG